MLNTLKTIEVEVSLKKGSWALRALSFLGRHVSQVKHLIASTQYARAWVFIFSSLEMKEWRLKEVKRLFQGHTSWIIELESEYQFVWF